MGQQTWVPVASRRKSQNSRFCRRTLTKEFTLFLGQDKVVDDLIGVQIEDYPAQPVLVRFQLGRRNDSLQVMAETQRRTKSCLTHQ